ncbi:MAG: hypothetical protein HOP27_09510 [Anaerolineales bacterium]|nr:hypothetical protein [Anaerolineales bacterium]
MRKVLALIFKFIAKTIAAFFAALFVLTAILVFLLLNIERRLFNAEVYKRALLENNFYEQVPVLAAEQLSVVKTFLADPCAANPLGCSIEGASPELQACLTEVLGEDGYVEIGTGQRSATDAELEDSQSCLDRFEKAASQPGPVSGILDENLLVNASAEVQDCVKQALGDEIYQTLSSTERQPTESETQQINTCLEQQTADSSSQTNTPSVSGQMTFLNDFTSEQWQALIVHLLPPDDLQYMVESALDQTFAYFNGETNTATIPLDKLKARLTGQAGRDLILLLVNAQPPCTEEQLSQISKGDFGEKGKPPLLCAASGKTLDKLMMELQRQLNDAASGIPDEAVLVKPSSPSDPDSGNGPLSGKDSQTTMRLIHRILNLSPLLPLALILLVTLFGVRSRKGWLRWWGVPIFMVGLITLSIGVTATPLMEWAWVNYALTKIPPLFSTSGLPVIGHDVIRFALVDLSKWIMIEASLITLLGLGAIVVSSLVWKKAEEADLPPASPAKAPEPEIKDEESS